MKTLGLLITLFGFAGCIRGSIEIPSACYNTLVDFPPVSLDAGTTIPPIVRELEVHVGNINDWIDHIMVINGALTAVSVPDFSFVDELMISVSSPVSGEDLVLWDIQNPKGNMLDIVAGDNNLLDYIDDDGNLTLKIIVSTQAHLQETWVINANLCAKVDVEKKYGL